LIALIDADIVVYRCAAFHENDPLEAAIASMNDMMYRIIQAVDASEYIAYLSSGDNERKRIDPTYKANRDGKPQPRHRGDLKDVCTLEWKAISVSGIEADDALGIKQCISGDGTSICSIDKDLLQIAGNHYNFVKDEYVFVEPVDGLRHFYRQLLVGDRADNVFGVDGIGIVKAGRIINHLTDEADMLEAVQSRYNDDKRLLTNGKLLWIHRKENDWWEIPQFGTPSETSGGVLRREEEV
jgi:DNA polymerase-1